MEIIELKSFNDDFKEVMLIFYNWWGQKKNKTLDQLTNEYQSILFKSELPKLYVLKDKDKVIGAYELNEHDNISKKEYKPFLANVFIKEEYRGNGYSKLLIESAKEEACKMGYNDLYLHSKHVNYYEKFDFKYLETIDTDYGPKRIFKWMKKK